MEKFVIEAVDLDKVHKVMVTKHPGSSWKLDKVVVKKGDFASMESVFGYDEYVLFKLYTVTLIFIMRILPFLYQFSKSVVNTHSVNTVTSMPSAFL